eukprot:8973647-Pyramimonas_sp.AAC.1
MTEARESRSTSSRHSARVIPWNQDRHSACTGTVRPRKMHLAVHVKLVQVVGQCDFEAMDLLSDNDVTLAKKVSH